MPINKNRCSITFDHENYVALRRLSEDTGQSMSSLINEMFGMMMPSLCHISAAKRMTDVGLKTTGEEAFRGFLQGMEKEFQGNIDEAERLFFEKTRDSDEAAEPMQANEDATSPEAS